MSDRSDIIWLRAEVKRLNATIERVKALCDVWDRALTPTETARSLIAAVRTALGEPS